ncbi:MAG: DUF2779 domain-containing protein [Dehalococcoidales bacterium]|nr:DUF2779 domain-containing protein [Dehalococcoidales bacterium]
MKPRFLTKSRFKLALECPTRLYYDGKPEYANQELDDSFLKALAEGGFQVGALATCYFPGGVGVETLDKDKAISQTNELLKRDEVVIFEAAIQYKDLFIRADILKKDGKNLKLIEVKAKSFDPAEDKFFKKDGTISSTWYKYLADAAFQKYVISCAMPEYAVTASLMLLDKTAVCPTDGLNQKFKISRDRSGRTRIAISPKLNSEDLSNRILAIINVDDCCEAIYQSELGQAGEPVSFAEYVDFLARCYIRDEKIPPVPSSKCKECPYKTTEDDERAGLKSGFNECWKESFNFRDEDLRNPTVLDIWNFKKTNSLLDAGRTRITDVEETDINPKKDGRPGLSSSQRQWLQVEKAQDRDASYRIDVENLRNEMESWVYPLHFIDFETSMVAIPFIKGRRPYEGIAFQYSHHMVYEDGRIEHRGQYLDTEPGSFPNYGFIRSLMEALRQDSGTIFRYAAHENTYLNHIYTQLLEDKDVSGRDELFTFIKLISKSTGSQADKWEGERNMVDMLELVKRYYYDPATGGSNSIKQVLPAILNSSKFLQEKYSKPIYGAEGGIPSLNFKNWTWITFENGRVVDPYNLLPDMFQDIKDREFLILDSFNQLKNGGAATTAYARMQFTEMSDYERKEISQALLKYCELDTMAMVMIYEAWREMIFEETGCGR